LIERKNKNEGRMALKGEFFVFQQWQKSKEWAFLEAQKGKKKLIFLKLWKYGREKVTFGEEMWREEKKKLV